MKSDILTVLENSMAHKMNDKEKLIQEYLDAVQEVKANNEKINQDKKSKKLNSKEALNKRREELKKLLTPLISLQNIYYSTYLNFHKSINDAFIDLVNELDWGNLSDDPQRYSFLPQQTNGIISTMDNIVLLKEQFYTENTWYIRDVSGIGAVEGGSPNTTSIKNIYKYWLPTLSEATIKNSDRLTQILVCYTIKKALNGDENASQKLFEIYEKRAKSGKTITNLKQMLSYKLFVEPRIRKYREELGDVTALSKAQEEAAEQTGTTIHLEDEEEVKSLASSYLWLIIRGFQPKDIFDFLFEDKEELRLFEPTVDKIVDFYISYFTDQIPQKIDEILSLINQYNSIEKIIDSLGITNVQTKLIKQECQQSVGTLGIVMSTLLNPYAPIQESTKMFNNFCYKPDKMGKTKNLTTWLFGGMGTPEHGKLNQILRDQFLPRVKEALKTDPGDISTVLEHDKEKDDEDLSSLENILKKKIEKNITVKFKESEEAKINRIHAKEFVKKTARALGITNSDLQFLLDYHSGNYTQEELAQKYSITKEQVRYKHAELLEKMQISASPLKS
jgi:hypothetical protein